MVVKVGGKLGAEQRCYQARHLHCDWLLDDINGDGAVDFNDIDRFVAVLSDGE